MPEEKVEEKKFLKITWQQIVSAVILAVFLGIFSWAGATLKGALDDVKELKEWKTATAATLNLDLANIRNTISVISTQAGSLSGEFQRLEIIVNRLDAVVEILENK